MIHVQGGPSDRGTQFGVFSHLIPRQNGFSPPEHHAPEAHRAQLEGRGGMMLEGGENPFCRGKGVRITFSYSKADL